uniref:Uncharacterized protein n=1 Tax=Anguilla anguilla TaxID=7936 RepID=A0A0E9QYF1_ANGAN
MPVYQLAMWTSDGTGEIIMAS